MIKKLFVSAALIGGILLVYLITVHSLITSTIKKETPEDVSHVIVLGAKLNGDVMSLSLYYRVREALTYLQNNPEAKVIVAGGQGEGEFITEAEAMARYFIENGIEKERIIKEDRSTTTLENFAYSRELVGDEVEEIIVVTNDFHLYRSITIAKRYDFIPYPLAAETPSVVKTKLWLREYVAVMKTWLFDW